MSAVPPPASLKVSPHRAALSAGTLLWRVHRGHRPVTAYNPVGSDPLFGGGRFDGTSLSPYPYLYAAPEQQTALLETLVRGVPFDEKGRRLIRRAAVAGLRVSALRPARDLTLVSLQSHSALAAVCQDEWLVQAEPSEYPQTRHWGHWLRVQAPWADGFVWPSRRDLGKQAVIIFGDRYPESGLAEVPGSAVDLDDADGAPWLNACLALYRVSIRVPRQH